MFLLLLSLISYSYSSYFLYSAKFVSTKNLYNGTLSYNGLGKACSKEFPNSSPCNKFNLLSGIWKYNLPPSWILTLDTNCLGYTTNSSDVDGTCIVTSFGYVTTCSCEEYLSVCCFLQ